MSKTKRELKEEVKWLKAKLDDSERECNKYFVSDVALRIYAHELKQELEFVKAEKKILEQTQEKPWTWVTDDPESLPKETGWYQILDKGEKVSASYLSTESNTRSYVIAWKPLSDKPKEGME